MLRGRAARRARNGRRRGARRQPLLLNLPLARALFQAGHRVRAGVEEVGHQCAKIRGSHAHAELELQILESVTKLGRALEPIVQALGQGLANDGVQASRHLLAVLVPALEAPVAHHEKHVEVVGRGEQPLAHQHLGQHDADREDVTTPVEIAARDLLGRHVAVLALERAGLGLGLALLRVRNPEVAQLHVPAPGDEDVGRRDVAMDEVHGLALGVVGVVGVVEGVENFRRHEHADGDGQAHVLLRRRAQQAQAVETLDVFERDEILAVLLAEVRDLHDLGVDELGGQLGLVDEHRHEGLVGRQVGQDALDDQQLLEAVGRENLRLEDLRHSSRRQALHQGVAAKLRGKTCLLSLDRHQIPILTRCRAKSTSFPCSGAEVS